MEKRTIFIKIKYGKKINDFTKVITADVGL